MALRILVYTGLLYQGLIKTREVQRGEKLPAVFPLALYNGRKRWHAARDVGDLIERLPGRLKRYHPAHRYFLLEEGAVSEDRLADPRNTVAGIIRLETSTVPADVRRAVLQLIQRLHGSEYVSQTCLRRLDRSCRAQTADARATNTRSERTAGD